MMVPIIRPEDCKLIISVDEYEPVSATYFSQDEAEKVDYAAVNVVKTSTKTYAKAVTRESSKDVSF